MNKFGLIIILIFALSIGAFAEVEGATADPSDIGVGARPLGIGKAYVGMSDDASCIFINPAGLGGIRQLKATSMAGQVLQEVDYTVFGGAAPTDWGTIGIGYISVGLPSIPVTEITGNIGSGTEEVAGIGSTNYSASVVTLSYSNELSKIEMFRDYRNITYGLNLKYFSQGFSGGGSAMEGGSGTGMDMDFGVQYKPNNFLSLGVSAINFLPENMGGKFTWDRGNVSEGIPALIKAGGTIKLFGKDSYYGGGQNVFVGLDIDMHPVLPRPAVYHTGVEWWPISILALRLGVDQKPKGTEDGIGSDNNLTAGIGLKFRGYTFDYCYHQFSDLNENTTNFFSIGYVGEDEVKKPAEKSKRVIPVIVASASLETFSDVPAGHWAKAPIEFMSTLGVMNGFYDGKFRPDEPVSRAELAVMLVKLRNLDVNDATSDPYPDVTKDYWAAKYIKAASYLNAMTSYPDGTFKPDKKLTRVEGVVILSRFTEAPEPATMEKDPFADISRTHWAAKYIIAAQGYGLLDYLIGKNFEPNKELTRAEVAELLSKTSYGKDRIRKYLQMGSR